MKTAAPQIKQAIPSATRMANHTSFFTPFIQPKLTINEPGDIYEQEADAIADSVMRMPDASARREELFFKPVPFPVQRKSNHYEEEENLHRKEANGEPVSATHNPETYVASLTGGQPLPDEMRLFFEPRFGHDFSDVRIHNDKAANASAAGIQAKAYTHGNDIVFGAGQYSHTREGKSLLAHELTHVIQQSGSTGKSVSKSRQENKEPGIQREALHSTLHETIQRDTVAKAEEKKVSFRISFAKPLTRDQFIDLTEKTIYGRRMISLEWSNVKDRYLPSNSPVTVWVPVNTLQQKLQDYGESVSKVISNLDTVQDAATYQRISRIIQKLTPAQWADYEKRITGKVDNADDFEKSVDSYLASQQQRKAELNARDHMVTKLYGLESLYQLYKLYMDQIAGPTGIVEAFGSGPVHDAVNAMPLEDQADYYNLTGSLNKAGFASIAEFDKYVKDYLAAFTTETVKIGFDILTQYDSILYKEGMRYENPAVVDELYQKLAPMRAEYAQFEKNAGVYNDFQKRKADYDERSRLPGNGGNGELDKGEQETAETAGKEAVKHKEAARQSVVAISDSFPVLKEDNLPLDRRLDKAAMAKADPGQLKALLKDHIAARRADIKKTEEILTSDPEKIFTLDKLLEASMKQQLIDPASIFGQIVQDKIASIKRTDMIIGFLVAVIAIALTIVSFGTGALAATAAVAAFGLSSVMAYQEFQKYETGHAAYGAGMLSDDPSLVWLIVSVVGAAIDLGQAVKAVKAISPLAQGLNASLSKGLNATNDLAKFNEGIKALEKAGEIDSKIARTAEQAALTRTKAAEAAKSLTNTLGSKMYSFPGPLADPEVYRNVVKLAFYRLKEGGLAFQQFVLEIRQARIAAKMADLTDEEMVLLKRAYEEGKAITSEAELIKYTKQTPLSGKSIILDENMLIARNKVAKGEALQEGEKKMMKYLDANPDAKLTITEELYDKVVGKMDTSDLHIIDSTAKAGSAEYDSVIQLLEKKLVGAAKGSEDRRLIADALFAKTEPGVIPSFVSHDPGIYKKLYMLDKADPDTLRKLGKPLAEVFPDGFEVVINGRKLKVLPVR